MKAIIGVLFALGCASTAAQAEQVTGASRQLQAQAYCAGLADANGVQWHETPEWEARNHWGGGFDCVTDKLPHCDHPVGSQYCATPIYWFELGGGD